MLKETVEVRPKNLHACPPISANQLLDTTLGNSYNLPFGDRQIYFYKVRTRGAVNIIGVQDEHIGGVQINQLLDSIRPQKATFGIDTFDLLNDWVMIDSPQNAERRARHEVMHGWDAFQRDKMMFWCLIKKDHPDVFSANWPKLQESFIPEVKGVIWWRIKKDRTREVVLDRLADHKKAISYKHIIKSHTADGENPHYLSSVLGVWLLAYFSPEIRADESFWKPRDTYSTDCGITSVNSATARSNIGTTQVGEQALRLSERFLDGRFRKNAERYILTHTYRMGGDI